MRPARVADSDVHRGYDNALDPYMLTGVGKHATEFWIRRVDEKCIETLCFPHYYQKTVVLDKDVHVTPFMDAALLPPDHRAHVKVSKHEVLFLRNKKGKAGSVEQMFYSGMFGGEVAVMEL